MKDDTKQVRDNKGRFVKGHKPLVRPKYELMRKYPKLICDTCYLKLSCADYCEGYVCAFKREFCKIGRRDFNYVTSVLWAALDTNYARIELGYANEIKNGGKINPKLTSLLNKVSKQMKLMYDLYTQINNSKSLRAFY